MSSPLLHESRCLCQPEGSKIASAQKKKIKDALWRVKSSFKLVQATDPKLVPSLVEPDHTGEARDTRTTTIPLIAPSLCVSKDAPEGEPPPKPIRVSPELLGSFNLIEKLGEGGMGTVFRARDRVLNREMAIKVMRAELVGDRAAIKRFQKEAAAAGDLTHPNIAQVYKCSADESAPYMVMEYVDGISMSQILKHERRISMKRLINMTLQICDALQYAHDKGVIHRDLKPSNIIVADGCHSDVIKVVDFGIAKLAPANDTTGLTQSGEVFGSPEYMSPEQAKGIEVDQRSDLYSLGCILFEALSGRKLFSGDNAIQILLHHINTPITDRLELLRTKRLPEPLIALVAKLLAKQPEKRYQSAQELAVDLQRFQLGTLSSWRLKTKKKTVVVAAASIVVALGTFISALILSDHPLKEGAIAINRSEADEATSFDSRAWTIVPPSPDAAVQSWFKWLGECDSRLDEPDVNGGSELRDARLYVHMQLDRRIGAEQAVPPDVMDALIDNVTDSSPSASEVASSTLISLGAGSVNPVMKELQLRPFEKQYENILWNIGAPSIDELYKRLSSDDNRQVQFAGWLVVELYTSGRFEDSLNHRSVDQYWRDSAQTFVITALDNLEDTGKRVQLLQFLEQIDDVSETTLSHVGSAMADDSDESVRGEAAIMLAKLSSLESHDVKSLYFKDIVSAYLNEGSNANLNSYLSALDLTPADVRSQVRANLKQSITSPSSAVRDRVRSALKRLGK